MVRKLCLLVGTERDRVGTTDIEEGAEEEAEGEENEDLHGLPERAIVEDDRRLEEDEQASAPESNKAQHPPLTWEAALAVLERTHCLQSLTIRLPKENPLREDSMTALSRLHLLRRLEISANFQLSQLWLILESAPLLRNLDVAGLVTGESASSLSRHRLEEASFHISSISMTSCELNDDYFHFLVSSTKDTLRSLRLSHFSGPTRGAFNLALKTVGRNLHRLALHKITFATTPEDFTLASLVDDLPRICPLLEELQVATDKICSEDHFLPVVLPSLFLTQLELDYKLPIITEQQVLDMIACLPHGRMETLCFGSSLVHLATPKVIRACSEMAIVVIGFTA